MKAPFPWFGDAMAYAKRHVEAGVLSIDLAGQIWRHAINSKGEWRDVQPRRAENVGGKGYLRISLSIPNTNRLAMVMAHNLVFECLNGAIPIGLEVNHIDLIKTNNAPTNLEVVTPRQNIQHSYDNGRPKPWSKVRKAGGSWRGKPVITEKQTREIRRQRSRGDLLKTIAARFEISTTHAHRLCATESSP